jgi:tRNA pseudouridine55 synthase
VDGVLVIDKPVGPTSHDIVARARRALAETRVGHTGTLDPAASGVLPLVVGKATRLARFLSAGDKSYDAVIRLGFATDSGDGLGARVGPVHAGALPGAAAVDAALGAFRGRFLQQPPAFSAKKVDGRRSYKTARAARARAIAVADGTLDPGSGPPVLLTVPEPVAVTVHALDVVSLDGDCLRLQVTCSAGFYVRALAHDLGECLGTGAHLSSLRRTRSGDYSLDDAVPLNVIEDDPAAAEAALVPLARMLGHLRAVALTPDGALHARQGRTLGAADFVARPSDASGAGVQAAAGSPGRGGSGDTAAAAEDWIRMFAPDGGLMGLARPVSGGTSLLHPSVVLI